MKKFFIPAATWDKGGKVIKFKSIKGQLGGNENKNKSKKKTKGLKPPENKDKALPKTSKVKSGRVEKKEKIRALKKQQQQKGLSQTKAAAATVSVTENAYKSRIQSEGGASAYAAKLQEQLMGGRFRFINEQLYTLDSREAQTLFQEESDAFSAYHAGYRHQVERWPLNPLDRIIKAIGRLPKSFEIVDFGCGEARLSQSLPNKVYSIDLVSSGPDIIGCDMANTPLKTHNADVAVYCLSLMGTNLNDFLLEANRVLKIGGLVFVAEIQSRFNDVRQFIRGVEACGFELIKQDSSAKIFYFFQFKKVRDVGKVAILPLLTLKPCLYRKR